MDVSTDRNTHLEYNVLIRSLREPGLPYTKSMEVAESRMRKYIIATSIHDSTIHSTILAYFGKREASDIPSKSELLMFSYFA